MNMGNSKCKPITISNKEHTVQVVKIELMDGLRALFFAAEKWKTHKRRPAQISQRGHYGKTNSARKKLLFKHVEELNGWNCDVWEMGKITISIKMID